MPKRNVFLFGAGAVLDWGAPSTYNLTLFIRSSGFKTKDNCTTITEWIYQRLLTAGFDNPNFETIINVIEELVIYYADFDSGKDIPSIQRVFFDAKELDELLNFDLDGPRRHGYRLQIPAGKTYPYSDISYHQETPEQFFFQHLIAELLGTICTYVIEYSYHSPDHSAVTSDKNKHLNGLASKWFKLLSQDAILRMYTLNYDRLFKVLSERTGISVFEGFDCSEYIDNNVALRANVPRIFSDMDGHVHYNVHGHVQWDLKSLDDQQLPNPELVLRAFPNLPINFEHAYVQIERGKTVMVTNIITGYQKTQKTTLSPFKQMQAALDRDCATADVIYIIGYSFGDEHINASIKTAIRYNNKLKIMVVDPGFISNNMDEEFFIRLFPFRTHGRDNRQKVRDNVYSYYDGDFIVHTITFKAFLELSPSEQLPRLSLKALLRP